MPTMPASSNNDLLCLALAGCGETTGSRALSRRDRG